MGIGGIVIVALIGVVLTLAPELVARRAAKNESREFDRFSPRMHLLDTYDEKTHCDACAEHETVRLIGASARILHCVEGGPMATQDGHTARPRVDALRGESRNVPHIAQLRARRAARLSRESAASLRRAVFAAVLALATVAMVLTVLVTSLTPWWILVPASGLLAVLGASRSAAKRSNEATRAEKAELARLKKALRDENLGGRPAVARHSDEDGAPAAHEGFAAVKAKSDSDDEDLTAGSARDGRSGAGSDSADSDMPVDEKKSEEAEASDVASPDGHSDADTWTPSPLPAPMYAARTRIEGRVVHAHTDLRGIPKVAAAVPARPVAASEVPAEARSTKEIAAESRVAFDLDAVLDSRRAAQ